MNAQRTIGAHEVSVVVAAMAESILKNEAYFCELDSHAGDGDFGASIAKGFRELKRHWETLDRQNPASLLRSCGMIIMEHCGGASGPIWGAALMSAARFATGKEELGLTDIPALFQSAIDGIQKRGGAKLGDKTLLDALIPATEALKRALTAGDDLEAAFRSFAEAARRGAEGTKEIVASRGRASYLGERGLGFPDAGAMALSIVIEEVATALGRRKNELE